MTKRPFMAGYQVDATLRGSPHTWRTAFRDRMGVDAAREEVKRGKQTPRQILGVLRTAGWSEIRTAYRKLVMQHHPDRGGDAAEFRKVQAAFEVLEDAMLNGRLAASN